MSTIGYYAAAYRVTVLEGAVIPAHAHVRTIQLHQLIDAIYHLESRSTTRGGQAGPIEDSGASWITHSIAKPGDQR